MTENEFYRIVDKVKEVFDENSFEYIYTILSYSYCSDIKGGYIIIERCAVFYNGSWSDEDDDGSVEETITINSDGSVFSQTFYYNIEDFLRSYFG